MADPKTLDPSKLIASAIRYSSVVGQSVALNAPDGRAVAQLAVLLPGFQSSDPAKRRETAESIARRIVELWNSQAPEVSRES